MKLQIMAADLNDELEGHMEELIEAERRRDDGALRFEENPNESEATVDGAAMVVIDQTDAETARARTRLARDAVERGVLAAALLAADAGAFHSVHGFHSVRAYDGFDAHSLSGDDEDHEETVDGLLENFVGVLLTALDDPACGDAGRSILLAGAAAESARVT